MYNTQCIQLQKFRKLVVMSSMYIKDIKKFPMSGLSLVKNPSDTEEEKKYEEMPLKHFDMICNPAYHAFKAGLEAFHQAPSVGIIDELHTILLIDNSQKHKQIQCLLTELYPYILRPELYEALLLLFSDVAHLNFDICDTMLEFDIFGKLDYSKANSFTLVLNICDGNRKAWDVFASTYLTEEMKSDSKVKLLIGQNVN